MADESTIPTRATGKVKSKWGKLFKEDSNAANGKTKFKLNEDVVDFLKPSTEKERYSGAGTRQLGAPQLDTGAAQKWPGAEDMKRVGEAGNAQLHMLPNGRPKRRKNLTVGFARTAPDIIGEGGDEADTPVIEVSRMKAKQLRSFSDRKPPALDTSVAEQHRQPQNYPMSAPPRNPHVAKPGLPRYQTSANETSYQLRQRPVESRSADPDFNKAQSESPQEHRPEPMPRPGMLKRAPTAFNEHDASSPTTTDEASPVIAHNAHPLPTLPVERLQSEAAPQMYDSPVQAHSKLSYFLETSPTEPNSPSAIIHNKMRAEEGQTLRRFSRGDMSNYVLPGSSSPPTEHSSPPRIEPMLPEVKRKPCIPQDRSSNDMSYTGQTRAAPQMDIPVSEPRQIPGPQYQQTVYYDDGRLPGHAPSDDAYMGSSPPETHDNIKNLQASYSSQNNARPLDIYGNNTLHASYSSHSIRPPASPGQFQGLTPSPSRGTSPSYFPPQKLSPQSSSSGLGLPPQLASRPSSQNSHRLSPPSGDSSESAAFADFSSRVEHMRGVFRLTAEREKSTSRITPYHWLRTAIWWLHKGRAGLGNVVKNSSRTPDGQKRELLTQSHVDVAKTWWIVTDVLENIGSPQLQQQTYLHRDVEAIRSHLRSLTLSMSRNGVMPPYQSLIQGQDTTIWVTYPRFASDVASVLRGSVQKALIVEDEHLEINPLEALPLGDTRDSFCYNRMFVNVSVNTEDADTDRVVLPCILTMLRGRSDYQTKIIISSQADLVNISIKPGDGRHGKGPTWQDVSWKNRSHGIYIRLPRGFTLNAELQEYDFRALWSMVEYTKKVEASLRPEPDERFLYEARLAELQYADSSNPNAFPKDRVKACSAFVFEKAIVRNEGTGARRLHRGYRLLLVTNTTNKTLSSVTHELCRGSPLLLEFIGNAAANEVPAMTIRVQETKRQCKATLVFNRANDRQELYEVLNSTRLSPDERLTGRVPLNSLVIEPSSQALTNTASLRSLRWQDVRTINRNPDEPGQEQGNTVLSQSLRMIINHDNGCLTDRLNLGKEIVYHRVIIHH